MSYEEKVRELIGRQVIDGSRTGILMWEMARALDRVVAVRDDLPSRSDCAEAITRALEGDK